MLTMRNRRRRSLVCVEFKVCPTPLCRHLSSLVHCERNKGRRVGSYETVTKMRSAARSVRTFPPQKLFQQLRFTIWDGREVSVTIIALKNADEEKTKMPVPRSAWCILSSRAPPGSLRRIDCRAQPCKVHFSSQQCLMELIASSQFSHHFP